MLLLSQLIVPALIVARRSGRGIAQALFFLYEGCTTGDPTAALISLVILAVFVGWGVIKFSGGSD